MDVGKRVGQYLRGRRSRGDGSPEEELQPVEGSAAAAGYAGGSVGVEAEARPTAPGEIDEGRGTMDDERMQILRMVEQHKVTAEEAAKLLAALETGSRPVERPTGPAPRWIRVRVTDLATGRSKVNVNIPIGVITAAGKLATHFGLAKVAEKEGIDLEGLFESIRSGAEGKLVDVTDEDDREHVEVYVE